jgi:folate-dependent phosphoribosylglycinamide formyltransferase PurN
MAKQRVLLLAGDGDAGRIAARYLAARFNDLSMIVEQPEGRGVFLRRRLKRLGWLTVAGQVAFMIVQRIQQRLSRGRIQAICWRFDLDAAVPDAVTVTPVGSVNSVECIDQLKRLDPAVVIVIGTRIIAAKVLHSLAAPFINYHAGITPKYRGVHGGYWALVEGDRANCGSTVHLVDEGIDSGGILYQARIEPTSSDNFSSYPYLQLAAALPLLAQAAEDAIAGRLQPQAAQLPSRLWSHPTLWAYVAHGLRRGIW